MAGKHVLPRARQDGLVIRELADETLVYDLERHKAHCLNQTAALIWKHCDGRTSVAEMSAILENEGHLPVDGDVMRYAVDRLGKKRLLEDAATWPADSRRLSRRDVIRKLGLAAAVALPLITTVVSPKAIQAATCVANGIPCTASAQCCNGCCKSQGSQFLCAGGTSGCV
jgi:hypothetical protein